MAPRPPRTCPRGLLRPRGQGTPQGLRPTPVMHLCDSGGRGGAPSHPRGRSSRPCSGPRTAGSARGWSRCPRRVSRTRGTTCSGGTSGLRGRTGRVTPCPAPGLGGQQGRARATRALTAELGAPPVQGQPPGVGALAGVLGEGVAEAAGEVGLAAVAEIMLAGLQVAAGIHQEGTAQERLAAQHLLADALGQSPDPSFSPASLAQPRGCGSKTPTLSTLSLTELFEQVPASSGTGS